MAGKPARNRLLDEEQAEFFRAFVPGHSSAETAMAMRERFGLELTERQVRNLQHSHGAKSGLHFGFQKGGVPKSTGAMVPVGSERLDRDGYIAVKVCERAIDNPGRSVACIGKCWRKKHHVVWEQANGRPVPEGHAVVFANRDTTDFDPANLVAIPLRVLLVMNNMRLEYHDRESLEAAIAVARVRIALKDKRKELNA